MAKRATAVKPAKETPTTTRRARSTASEVSKKTNGPTPERRAEVLAEYTILTTAGQRNNQAKSTLLKNFASEGGDPKALKSLHASLKLDPAEAAAKLDTLVQYHHGAGIKVRFLDSGQGTVIDELVPGPRSEANEKLAKARAYSDGYNSGLKGNSAPHDNPKSIGSEEYVEWHNGRDDGQRDRLLKNPALGSRVAASQQADPSMPGNGIGGIAPPA